MDKILGKITTIFLLVLSINLHAYITLEVNSFDGRKITEVVAGEPFVLQVSTDEVDQVHGIQIQGLQGFAAQKTGLSLITVNGKKTAQVTYQVQADKPGSYTFGPAFVPNGQTQSDTVALQVNAERITDPAAGKKDTARNNVMLQLAVDTDTAFVGQKIKTRLRVYFLDGEDISIEQVIPNDPPSIDISAKAGPKQGLENINGSNYTFLEWQWDMYPKEPGSLIIPAYFVDYAKALPPQQGFGGFAMFFGPRYERKRVYSNALSVQVRPLPESQQPVDAIGSFVSYRAQIKPPVAKKYEGMVLTLTVEGEGNMERIREPELRGLPDAFKYYFSKSIVTPGSFGQQKSFEYIVQGMQEGEWEIPEQTFSFFDIENRSYKTLESGALLVTVSPGQAVVPSPAGTPACTSCDEAVAAAPVALLSITNDALPMDGALSFGWFAFLLALPIGIFGVIQAVRSARLVQKVAPQYLKRRAFVLAHKDLARAYRHHDVRAIHSIFMQLIARRTYATPDISIEQAVAASAWSESQKAAWQVFYDKVSQAAYADSSGTKDVVRLFHEAEQRLKDLERVI